MKAIFFSLYIFGACTLAANAQTSTANATMDVGPGYSKYMELEPLAIKPSKKSKKLEIERNPHRVNPESQQPEIAQNKKKRIEKNTSSLALEN